MFNLEKHECQLTNLNTRLERHGDERALAMDIKINTKAGNAVLDSFGPALRESLFRKPGNGEQQDLPTIGEALSAVKHPYLDAQRLNHEFTGYEMEIAGLLDSTEPVFLADVKLKKFVITPLEGGSVELTFTASANCDPEDLAPIGEFFVREDVRLSLTPPSKQQAEDDGQQDLDEAA